MDKLKNEHLYSYKNCGNNDCHHESKLSDCIVSKKIHYDPCEVCTNINTKPINLSKCTNRFLKVKVTLNNVCFDKEICIGVILCDHCGKIVDFKGFTTVLRNDCNSCCDTSCCDTFCGTLKRKIFFVLPKSNLCRPLNLTAHIVANYTSSCKASEPCC